MTRHLFLFFSLLVAHACFLTVPARTRTLTPPHCMHSFLVEAPPNVCTPTHLADAAKHIAARAPERFSLEVGALHAYALCKCAMFVRIVTFGRCGQAHRRARAGALKPRGGNRKVFLCISFLGVAEPSCPTNTHPCKH